MIYILDSNLKNVYKFQLLNTATNQFSQMNIKSFFFDRYCSSQTGLKRTNSKPYQKNLKNLLHYLHHYHHQNQNSELHSNLLQVLSSKAQYLITSKAPSSQFSHRAFVFMDHSFGTYVKFSEKLTFLTHWYTHVHVCIKG